MDVPVYWVIDKETDQIVGSTHNQKTAKVMASEHEAQTQHHSRVRRIMMAEHYTT